MSAFSWAIYEDVEAIVPMKYEPVYLYWFYRTLKVSNLYEIQTNDIKDSNKGKWIRLHATMLGDNGNCILDLWFSSL